MHQQAEEKKEEVKAADATAEDPLISAFYRTIEAEIEDHNEEREDESYDNNSHRAGRVLAFLKTPTDFYDWLKFLLDDIYHDDDGPPVVDPALSTTTGFSSNWQTNDGKIMMDSSYIMGMRLQIYNS